MRHFFALACVLFASMQHALASDRDSLPPVEVFAPSPCLSCIDWADHLRKSGFEVTMTETLAANMPRLKRWLNVPSDLESVHTAKVAGYFIEGHVPAEDILQLLKEKPRARGLAVPGLPRGSPGRELSNPFCETACTILDNAGQERDIRRERYDTLLVGPDGKTSIFARH
ncbi:MAG: metal-binding protein [Sulfuritalea sp.]|nr:metal-binding protein [Sulfuritalea sp.]